MIRVKLSKEDTVPAFLLIKLLFFVLMVTIISSVEVYASNDSAQPEKYTMAYGDTVRTYSMYLPTSIGDGAPLVVYTHGYGSKTRWRDDLNAVATVAANNRCTTMTIDTFPTKCDASRLVKRTTYSCAPSDCDVIIYEIEGGKHSWADDDVDTSRILWVFFQAILSSY